MIYTSGATSAIKLVGECFVTHNFDRRLKTFVYTQENHTSVLGLRHLFQQYCDISIHCLQANSMKNFLALEDENTVKNLEECGLFSYPAQCNFSGSKYPLEWIECVHKGCMNSLPIESVSSTSKCSIY